MNHFEPPDFDGGDEYSAWSAAMDWYEEELRLSEEARQCHRRRNWQRARELYFAIVDRSIPDLTFAYAEDTDGARRFAEWETDMRRWRAWHWGYLGFVCLHLRDKKAAWTAFQAARREDADCGVAWFGLMRWTLQYKKWRAFRHYLSRWQGVACRIRAREQIEA